MSTLKTLYEIIGDMRQFYEANQGYPVSAGSVAGYERKLTALARMICPMKNANGYRDANEAVQAWNKKTHEMPIGAELPQWVKDFVNWLMAEEEA